MRITHITAGLITFVLMMVICQAAAAQASATTQAPPPPSAQAGPQDRPSTPAPDQQQQPQNMPSQPSAGQSQAAPSDQANQSQSQSSDSDNPLNLTEDQKTKLRPIIADENQKMEAVRNDSSLSTDQKIEKANQIREEASPKIRAILTPDQLQKLAELQQKARQQRDQNQGPSAPQK